MTICYVIFGVVQGCVCSCIPGCWYLAEKEATGLSNLCIYSRYSLNDRPVLYIEQRRAISTTYLRKDTSDPSVHQIYSFWSLAYFYSGCFAERTKISKSRPQIVTKLRALNFCVDILKNKMRKIHELSTRYSLNEVSYTLG